MTLSREVHRMRDIDNLLALFLALDYLLMDKIEETEAGQEALEGKDGKVTERGEFCG